MVEYSVADLLKILGLIMLKNYPSCYFVMESKH
jgi:hypothetical protein